MRSEPRVSLAWRVHGGREAGRFAAALACAAAVAACGGGGDEPAGGTALASLGDASRYVATWESECGRTIIGTRTHSVRIIYQLTAASGRVATGTVTVIDYGELDLTCLGTGGQNPTTGAVTLTIDATPVVASGYLSGQADRVTIERPSSSSQVAFIAFEPGFARFRLNPSATFEQSNVVYRKF